MKKADREYQYTMLFEELPIDVDVVQGYIVDNAKNILTTRIVHRFAIREELLMSIRPQKLRDKVLKSLNPMPKKKD